MGCYVIIHRGVAHSQSALLYRLHAALGEGGLLLLASAKALCLSVDGYHY